MKSYGLSLNGQFARFQFFWSKSLFVPTESRKKNCCNLNERKSQHSGKKWKKGHNFSFVNPMTRELTALANRLTFRTNWLSGETTAIPVIISAVWKPNVCDCAQQDLTFVLVGSVCLCVCLFVQWVFVCLFVCFFVYVESAWSSLGKIVCYPN